MRAVRRIELGRAEVVETAVGSPGEDEVLIDVMYAAVNPFDIQVLEGDIGQQASPLTLGAECTGLWDGRLVQVSGGGLGSLRDGTFAQQVLAPAASVRPLASEVDPLAAASVGIAGATAWRVVHQLAQTSHDDVVVVLGAAGGVGMIAAQLARAAGARVLAHVGQPDKAAALDGLGVEPIVGASPDALVNSLDGARPTVVLDPLGGQYVASLLPVLEHGARVVSYGTLAGRHSELDMGQLYRRGIRLIGTSGATTSAVERSQSLAGVIQAVLDGSVRVRAEILPLDGALGAFERLRERSVVGKLLLET